MRSGNPSISQSEAIHGPTATTTWSTSMVPCVVCTAVTAPESSRSNPVTSTPVRISAPAARAFSARPSIDSRLNAYPPACSCRHTVRPGARQSPYSERMWAATSSSPTYSSDG